MNEKPKLPLSHQPRSRSGTEKRQKDLRITVRVSPADDAEIKARAGRAGLSPSGYLRTMGVDSPEVKAKRRAMPDHAAVSLLLGQVRKAGGNVHEILKAIRFTNPFIEAELRQAVKDLDAAALAILELMGRKVE